MVLRYEIATDAASARGLTQEDALLVRELVYLWRQKLTRNQLRDRYYKGHVKTKSLGVSISPAFRDKINSRVDWPAKAVDYLAARSQFDGFVSSDEKVSEELKAIVSSNNLKNMYRKAVASQLKHCCCAWAVTASDKGPVISAYPMTAAALMWDDARKEVSAGLVVAETKKKPNSSIYVPTVLKLFTKDALVVIANNGKDRRWEASYYEHSMGRPLIEPMSYKATLERPFGSSRITRAVMGLTDDAQREKERSEIAAEFAAYPQKFLLNTDKRTIPQNSKFDAYIGSILEISKGKDGSAPVFGQLSQLSMQPHIDYMRSLALQFSAATNIPLSSLGVVSDNPSSAEAIYAEKEEIVIDAQDLNAENGRALTNVAMMALAVLRGTDFATIQDTVEPLMARFRNPAMPSVVSQSDAIVKQVSAISWIGESEVALEELGYTQEQISRLLEDKKKAQATAAITALIGSKESGNADTTKSA